MRRAQKRDAVNSVEMFFRKSLVPEDEEDNGGSNLTAQDQQTKSHEQEYTLMTVDTIVNGKVREVGICTETNTKYISLPTYMTISGSTDSS